MSDGLTGVIQRTSVPDGVALEEDGRSPRVLAARPDLQAADPLARVPASQKKAFAQVLSLYPAARVEDLLAMTHSSSWARTVGARINSQWSARIQADLLRIAGLLSSASSLFKTPPLNPVQQELARNTLDALLRGGVWLRLLPNDEYNVVCNPNSYAATDLHVDPVTKEATIYLREEAAERDAKGTGKATPFELVSRLVHEVTHALTFKALGVTDRKNTPLLSKDEGWAVLATEYNAYLTQFIFLGANDQATKSRKPTLADSLKRLLNPAFYSSSSSLIQKNGLVRQYVQMAIDRAAHGRPIPSSEFIGRLWDLRQRDYGWRFQNQPDAVERNFFTSVYNDRNEPVRPPPRYGRYSVTD